MIVLAYTVCPSCGRSLPVGALERLPRHRTRRRGTTWCPASRTAVALPEPTGSRP